MAGSLEGKTALVTGGSRGIGRATAVQLAREGAAVVVNYHRRAAAADAVVQEIRSSGGRALAFGADVGGRAAVEEMFEHCQRELGPIEILVNNAGLFVAGDLSSYNEDGFDQMWQINVKGIVHCTAAAVDSMKVSGFGRVINLSSIAAQGTAFAGTTFYAATKAAVLALTRRFALELGPHGICVNAVSPGLVSTDMPFEGKSREEIEKTIRTVSERTMLRRVGAPEEIASLICFLASPEASFITAQILTADGGRMDFLTHS